MQLEIEQREQCPICHENIRYEWPIHAVCELCGMAIHQPSRAPKLQNKDGEKTQFCCDRCHSIYIAEISANQPILEYFRLLSADKCLSEEDQVIKDEIIAYINEKYPMIEEQDLRS